MKGWKSWEDEKEDLKRYWTILRKREENDIWKWKHKIAICRELVLEEAMGQTVDTKRN